MTEFLSYLLLGLSHGAGYALVALSLVVVFRGTGHINFAQGEMATLSAYVVWWLSTDSGGGLPLAVAVVIAMVFGAIVSATAEIAIVRPLDKRSPLAAFVGIIALFLGIHAFTSGVWGALPDEIIGSLFPKAPHDFVSVAGVPWRYESIGVLLTTLLAMAALFAIFRFTKFGLSMRATASNPASARLVGIRTGFVLAGSWAIAGALGALAGALFAGVQGQVTPLLMFNALIYAVAAATLGGLDSPGGAVIAALLIGVVETAASGYFPNVIGNEMQLTVALLAILGVLLIKPSGLFGSSKIERV